MYPVLFKIGGLEIRTYGVMLLAAFLAAGWWVAREMEKHGVKKDDIWNLAVWIMVAGVVGARGLYVWEHWSFFKHDLLEALKVWHGGLTFYGGFLLAIPVGIWYAKRKKMPLAELMDAVAPGVALGIFLGRIGCYFNGCCYGRETGLPWGIVYPPGHPTFPHRVHPSPLYESFAELVVALLLIFVVRKKRPYPGFVFWVFIIFAATIRFLNDFTRDYAPTAYIFGGPLTFNQWIAIGLVMASVAALIYLGRRARRAS